MLLVAVLFPHLGLQCTNLSTLHSTAYSSHWPCVLLGNKRDCISSFRQVPTRDGEALADVLGVSWGGEGRGGRGGEGREGKLTDACVIPMCVCVTVWYVLM